MALGTTGLQDYRITGQQDNGMGPGRIHETGQQDNGTAYIMEPECSPAAKKTIINNSQFVYCITPQKQK